MKTLFLLLDSFFSIFRSKYFIGMMSGGYFVKYWSTGDTVALFIIFFVLVLDGSLRAYVLQKKQKGYENPWISKRLLDQIQVALDKHDYNLPITPITLSFQLRSARNNYKIDPDSTNY